MTDKKRLYGQRVCLILFGVGLSILCFEIVLRLYVYLLNDQKTYTFNKELVHSIVKEQQELSRGYERNDIQEEYSAAQGEKGTIYTIGDSFTNGGNLIYTSSYPYKLYHKLEQTWTVHNMGVCESTSADSLKIIQELLTKKIKKNSYFLILTGATDIFAGADDSIPTMATPLISIQRREKVDQAGLESFLSHFKSYLLVKELFRQIKQSGPLFIPKYDLATVERLNRIIESPKYKDCANHNSHGHCLAKNLSSEEANDARDYILEHLLKLELGMDSKDYSKKINDLLDYLDIHAHTLKDFSLVDMTATLAFISSKQSQFSYQDILKRLRIIQNSLKLKEYPLFANAIHNFAKTIEDRRELLEKRRLRLFQIANILKKANMKPVFLTYPLSYSEVNQSIRDVAQETHSALIDLEIIFNKRSLKKKEDLLVDYQHLTSQGNEIVADAISASLEKLESN
tara:strand:- start:97077 stop:98444 length:1368 start_codon:yes stop_codon:yes gene_type:complete